MLKTKEAYLLAYYVLSIVLFVLISCQSSNENKNKPQNISQSTKANPPKSPIAKAFETDTKSIEHKKFVFCVYKNDSSTYLKVEKEYGDSFKTILVDSSYSTNNADIGFYDSNDDGFDDLNWYKKWQNHAYLYNPKKENFVEVGELHDIETLKIGDKPVLYKNRFPILYLRNDEKGFDWMIQRHSELFIINDQYQKISFATLDNFASLEDWNIEKCRDTKSVVVHCYIPPYHGRYNSINIWNSGKSVDSIFMKSTKFDSSFIANYWKKNYASLLKYGQVFTVRREKPIQYFH